MGVRHKYEFVKQSFENEGYILLSKKYKNSTQKLKYICPEGHRSAVSFDAWFNKGHRCKKCAHEKLRLNLDFIKNEFKKEGYILLTDRYINSKQKLQYICPSGHSHSISFNGWYINGSRCAYCKRKAKKTIEFIRSDLFKYGYTLISKEYKNAHTKFEYRCPKGHIHSINWINWSNGYRCPTCYYLSKFGETNPNWRGGVDTSPYCVIWRDKGYKSGIKDRDGNMCLNPYCNHNDDLLSVHHIDYDKKNCKPNNLITICRSCNSRANTDRE